MSVDPTAYVDHVERGRRQIVAYFKSLSQQVPGQTEHGYEIEAWNLPITEHTTVTFCKKEEEEMDKMKKKKNIK